MMQEWRRRRQAKRVKPGDGSPLPRFRWWQLLSRSLFTLELVGPDGRPSSYAVDVRQAGDKDDGEVRARLYVDGALRMVSRVPARFPVPGGEIEVVVGGFGMKRCHLVAADGSERQLVPHPRSAEGRRARFDRDHPVASRGVGALSLLAVLVGLCLALPALAETISEIPPVAQAVGTFKSPLNLPGWLLVTVGVAAVVGSIERALRLRSSWIDDLAS
ncbi:hypothetical protein [Cellulomonas xylanilytica]|uniref:Uncharacterized protein n=1 Tax=Cellulomonas xylanilytica TaxID=233583 RepID=A0A510V588_9CELL|nr:hypothetical protein [Cellulomonas xylanilytica]GEK22037.1 hypothetical protein CXY01_25570 [Cellulomonas xylanilytica]